MMKITNLLFNVAFLGIILISTAHSGTIIIITSPQANGTAPNQFIPISKYDARTTGVSFGAIYGIKNGKIDAWNWIFQNGSPLNKSIQNPGKVIFGSNSVGKNNRCTVGVLHKGSLGENENCTSLSNVVIGLNVNVIQPKLVFNTAGPWSKDDTAYQAANKHYKTDFKIGGNEPTYFIGYDEIGNPYNAIGCAYEYIYTVQAPKNSGASTQNIGITEIGSPFKFVFYKKDKKPFTSISNPKKSYYNDNSGNVNFPRVVPPENPTMYAFDSPSFDKNNIEDIMKNNNYYYLMVEVSLMSYPTYADMNGEHLDLENAVSHTFYYYCSAADSTGKGPYKWTVSY